MSNNDFVDLAKEFVSEYHNLHEMSEITQEDVFVVWLAKALQNNKAILSSTKGQKLYEFTWNGDLQEGYLDVYEKVDNVKIVNEGRA